MTGLMLVPIMITTINRTANLCRTCEVLQHPVPPPLEVLITMDGCTVEVIAVAKAELPEARLFVNEIGLGSAASRDRMPL
jgi:hypothetical protein